MSELSKIDELVIHLLTERLEALTLAVAVMVRMGSCCGRCNGSSDHNPPPPPQQLAQLDAMRLPAERLCPGLELIDEIAPKKAQELRAKLAALSLSILHMARRWGLSPPPNPQ